MAARALVVLHFATRSNVSAEGRIGIPFSVSCMGFEIDHGGRLSCEQMSVELKFHFTS